MADRPLIVFPRPAQAARSRLGGGAKRIHLPTHARQASRLRPRFEALRKYFERQPIILQVSPAGQVPEEVIVFETVGPVTDFFEAAARIAGLDMLGEWDIEDVSPDADFFQSESTGARAATSIMATLRPLREATSRVRSVCSAIPALTRRSTLVSAGSAARHRSYGVLGNRGGER